MTFIPMVFILVAAVLLPSCGIVVEKRRYFISSVPYEKENWLRADSLWDENSGLNSRPKMARFLTENNVLIGKSREEIYEMLGKKEQDFSESKTISYDLQEFYRSIDPVAFELLTITFNDQSKVEKAEIEFHKTSGWRYF